MPPSAATVLVSALSLFTTTARAAAAGAFELALEKHAVIDGVRIPSKGVYQRSPSIQARQVSNTGSVETTLFDVLPWSTGGAYYTNITVGTPPEVLTVIVDTGSSDLYVDASSSAACKNTNSPFTCRGGSFDPSKSSTYKVAIANGFSTAFGDGSTASGDFATDVVGVGDALISNVQFGVASTVNSTTGFAVSLMGVGYSANEASRTPYPNIVEVLHQAGAINSRLYSVFLNSFGDATGTILFGAIDTAKYTGQLQTLDLIPQTVQSSDGSTLSAVYQFVLSITGLTASSNGQTTTILSGGDVTGQNLRRSLPVLLDTGSSAWTVSTSVYTQITALFNGAVGSDGSIACSHRNDNVTLSIEFGGKATITVPASSFIVPVYNPATNQAITTKSGTRVCAFMLTPDSGGQQLSQQGFLTLGDAILRSMYVVFDLDNGQLSIAQANANANTDATSSGSGSNVMVVQAGAQGVASAVGSANGGVSTASANTYTILHEVTASQTLSLKTASTAVGAATGVAALPGNARVSGSSGSSGSGSSSGSAAASSSTGAAASVRPSGSQSCTMVVFTVWAVMLCIGMAIVL